ncbi:MAG: Fe-S protein assembly co-chaperone HscB, partial [Burkholderiaceae bacterium]
ANHFALFGLPERYALDSAALDRAYRELQSRVHPDRFAASGAAEQRVALQWATQANEAYRVLRDPLNRAIYLCDLKGHDPARENNTNMPQEFLVEQLEWRESLDDARASDERDALAALDRELASTRERLSAEIEVALDRSDDADGDADAAAAHASELVRQWMFVERFGEDVATASDRLRSTVN